MQETVEDAHAARVGLVAKGELVLRAYEGVRDALRESNDRAEASLRNAETWRAHTHQIEALIPVAYTQILSSARSAVNAPSRLQPVSEPSFATVPESFPRTNI